MTAFRVSASTADVASGAVPRAAVDPRTTCLGGMLVATCLSLACVPVFYAVIERLRRAGAPHRSVSRATVRPADYIRKSIMRRKASYFSWPPASPAPGSPHSRAARAAAWRRRQMRPQ